MGEISAQQRIRDVNYHMTKTVLPVTIFIGFEMCVGLIGNILILFIYTRRPERSNFRYFVIMMAVVDLMSCFTTLPGEIFSQLNWYDYQHGWICKCKSFFNVLTAWCSACILFVLAIDRYIKVCRPLKWQIRPTVALKLCVLSLILSSVVASPVAVLWGKQTYNFTMKDNVAVSVTICEKAEQFSNDDKPFIYIICVYILPVTFMMFIVCSLNFLTAKKLFGRNVPFGQSARGISRRNADSAASISSVASTLGNFTETYANLQQNNIIRSASNELVNRATSVNDLGLSRQSSSSRGSTEADIEIIDRYNNVTTEIPNDVVIRRANAFCASHNTRHHASNSTFSDISSAPTPVGSIDTLEARTKQKTIIMLVLTIVFVVTMALYVILISFVDDSNKVLFFFFWRLYFMNTVINPILYGFTDPRFRLALIKMIKRKPNADVSKFSCYICMKNRQLRTLHKRPVFTLT
ncbi:hypothetical protein DPMN_167469 [Dreissena polymorpha]|uniref:G-protein coupled receptors family 1 profile domain-containing protein n=1 Tax=Dreissena polymorpha TaxID=45954 RepID=A0A9D4EYW4_DREPO|nr:hypothetical protein DPMN_167469 [Dreissena polymorpha]